MSDKSVEKKVLMIVDDESDVVELLKFRLESAGFGTLVARNGVEAVEKAKVENPNLILLDIMMPVMDGFETCRILKSEGETKHIPVIMLTAKHMVGDLDEGMRIGADDYITKPYDARHLIERIKRLIK